MPNPQITPEMYAELMAQQGQTQGGEPAPGGIPPQGGEPAPTDGGQMTPEQFAAMQQQMAAAQQGQPQGGEPTEDEQIAQARQVLGLDATEQQIAKMSQMLQQMQVEKTQAQMQAKYPDVPPDAVQQEIDKIAQSNPTLAEAMKTTPEGMEMAYRAALASLKPSGKPDNLTDEGGNGGQEETIEKAVSEGKADDFTLGDYILGMKA